MDISRFRNIIKVLRPTKTRGDYGEFINSYELVYGLKANVKENRGQQVIDNDEIFNSKSIEIECYYRNVNDNDLIEYKDNRYTIDSINEIGYRLGLTINATLINE